MDAAAGGEAGPQRKKASKPAPKKAAVLAADDDDSDDAGAGAGGGSESNFHPVRDAAWAPAPVPTQAADAVIAPQSNKLRPAGSGFGATSGAFSLSGGPIPAPPLPDFGPNCGAGTVPYSALVATFGLIEATTKRLEITAHLASLFRSIIALAPGDLLPAMCVVMQRRGYGTRSGGSLLALA